MRTSLIIGLNSILGTNVNTNVNFKRLDSLATRGYYTDSSNTVTINIHYFDPSTADSDSYKIMQTMIHEMRHAYQHSAIGNPSDFVVSEETISAW